VSSALAAPLRCVLAIQKFFTHRSVSTFDRSPFQLTGELFLYGTTLSAGIPLTHVDHGKHYVVCSAHDPDGIDFHAFNGIDTCVFLMVGKSLPVVCERLARDAGKRSDAPAAVIKNGRTREEEVFRGTLGTMAEVTAGRNLSPCVLVVGEVAREEEEEEEEEEE
jgi:uroporphyrin-III C-methyltransferase